MQRAFNGAGDVSWTFVNEINVVFFKRTMKTECLWIGLFAFPIYDLAI